MPGQNVCRENLCRQNVCRQNVCRQNVCWQNICRQNVCWQNDMLPTKLSNVFVGEGKTMCTFSVSVNAFPLNFHFACYQQVRSAWAGGNGMEIRWALAENVYIVLPHPCVCFRSIGEELIRLERGNPQTCLSFVKKHSQNLHPNHYYLVSQQKICIYVCVWERESVCEWQSVYVRERVCVLVSDRECVCERVYERECVSEWEIACVSVCVCVIERVWMWVRVRVCVWVCEWERECLWVRESVWERERESVCVWVGVCVLYMLVCLFVNVCMCVYGCINQNEHDNNKQPIKLSKYFAKIMGMVLTNLNFEEPCPSFRLSYQ